MRGGRWPDATMVDACNACLWNLDARGELHEHYTRSAERVRDAVVARTRSGEMYPHA